MKNKTIYKIGYILVILFFLAFTLGPIIWCFIMSITPESEIFRSSGDFLPSKINWGNYLSIFDRSSQESEVIFRGLKNSLMMSVTTMVIGIPTSLFAAYSFYRYKFRAREFVMKFLMLTIVIPVFTTIIPIYSMFAEHGMLDSVFWVAIIYVSSFIPITTWTMMNYFKSIPRELVESASIEGCDELQIFLKIIMPLSTPIIFTCILIVFIMSWNQFQIPLILISSHENKLVTMVLSEFISRNDVRYGMISASGIISLIIPAMVAVLFRKHLISGLMQGTGK